MTGPIGPPPPVRRQDGRTWGDGPRRLGLAGALADAVGVIVAGLRLLARHWPALLALFLAGVVARELVMRAAVKVSLINAELGMLVLVLAPMTTLTALVLMLRVVRPSLSWLGSRGRATSVVNHLGSVLVPFMAVYYFEADLYLEDIQEYDYRVWLDSANQSIVNLGDALQSGTAPQPATDPLQRLPYDLSLVLIGVVLAAVVARWLLSRWPATERRAWLGIPGAYLELVWITLVFLAFMAVSELIIQWGENRRAGGAITALWDNVVGTQTGLASAPDNAAAWFTSQLGYIDAVLVIPISWLAVGAVVLGHEPPPAVSAAAERAARDRGRQLYQRAEQRWLVAPRALRWLGEKVTEDIRGRFTPLVRGIRMLVRAGAVPMLLFCLAFVAARTVPDWLWQLERLVIGPQDFDLFWFPMASSLSSVNDAVGYALLICLLAAAVDRALRYSPLAGGPAEDTERAAQAGPAQAEPALIPPVLPPPVAAPAIAAPAIAAPAVAAPPVAAPPSPGPATPPPHSPVPPPPGPVAVPPGTPQPTSSRT